MWADGNAGVHHISAVSASCTLSLPHRRGLSPPGVSLGPLKSESSGQYRSQPWSLTRRAAAVTHAEFCCASLRLPRRRRSPLLEGVRSWFLLYSCCGYVIVDSGFPLVERICSDPNLRMSALCRSGQYRPPAYSAATAAGSSSLTPSGRGSQLWILIDHVGCRAVAAAVLQHPHSSHRRHSLIETVSLSLSPSPPSLEGGQVRRRRNCGCSFFAGPSAREFSSATAFAYVAHLCTV